jgi:hypothetical protein
LQLDESLLEEEFDPDKWEQQMQKAFGENYYDQVRSPSFLSEYHKLF